MGKFALIGYPVAHSQSPRLFKAAYGGKYDYDLIEEEDFDKAWERARDYDAFNVTAPFKGMALERAKTEGAWLSPECELMEATNLIARRTNPSPGQPAFAAYNTDYSGVAMLLLEIMKDIPLRTALVIGCGGAGKAAATAATEVGLKVSLSNRSIDKAEAFAAVLGEAFGPKHTPKVYPLGSLPEADIVIYTLPAPIDSLEKIKCKAILEAAYRERSFSEEILQNMKENGCDAVYIPGERWLIAQARNGFMLMSGIAPQYPITL